MSSNHYIIQEAFIDNLAENKSIGFDLSLLERDKLHVNLIHFDLKIRNKENYGYYNKFKVDVVGGYLAMDDLKMLIIYLEAIKMKGIPFIVICSGTSGKDVIPICEKYSFIKEVIIFCGNYSLNEHYQKEYPKIVKKVSTTIQDVYNYIKSFGAKYDQAINEFKKSDHFIFSEKEIKMNKQLEQCPVISAYEYDNCYFLIHRAYAHFFGNMNDKNDVIFTQNYFNKIKDYINNSDYIIDKPKLIKQFESLVNKPNFAELSIREYTKESGFCYIFNRTMRNFEEGLISFAYYMGPFLFAVNKYVKENPINFKFNKDMTLYRNIQCSIFDFYLYKMNLNHIICFPSITSTSLVKGQFQPTITGQKYNNLKNVQFQPNLAKMNYNNIINGQFQPNLVGQNYNLLINGQLQPNLVVQNNNNLVYGKLQPNIVGQKYNHFVNGPIYPNLASQNYNNNLLYGQIKPKIVGQNYNHFINGQLQTNIVGQNYNQLINPQFQRNIVGQKHNNGINFNDMYNVTMIFNYKHNENYISPGIIVKNNIAKDGQYMSNKPYENEVILFPFTFARITRIKEDLSQKNCEIYFDIINRNDYIEYGLKGDNVEKRIKFSSLD